MDSGKQTKVLVVCLGNICRSPMGKAVLQSIVKDRGLDIFVDSAGTAGYHANDPADERSVAVCNEHGIPLSHSARKVIPSDFTNFTHILAADRANLSDLQRMRPRGATAHISLWGAYLGGEVIPDPYYGGIDGFEKAFQLCTKLSNAFLDNIVSEAETS